MERPNTDTQPEIPALRPRTIEYAGLLNTIQLSIARTLNLPKATEAQSFTEILDEVNDEEEKQRIVNEVGSRFDQHLIHFVTACLVARREPIAILAEESEGIGGYLPWVQPLMDHLDLLRERGILNAPDVRVVRYAARANSDDTQEDIEETIKALSEQAQLLAA